MSLSAPLLALIVTFGPVTVDEDTLELVMDVVSDCEATVHFSPKALPSLSLENRRQYIVSRIILGRKRPLASELALLEQLGAIRELSILGSPLSERELEQFPRLHTAARRFVKNHLRRLQLHTFGETEFSEVVSLLKTLDINCSFYNAETTITALPIRPFSGNSVHNVLRWMHKKYGLEYDVTPAGIVFKLPF